jgi:hypothetical protein
MKNRQEPYDVSPKNGDASRERYDERDRRLSLLIEHLFTFVEEIDQAACRDIKKADLNEL